MKNKINHWILIYLSIFLLAGCEQEGGSSESTSRSASISAQPSVSLNSNLTIVNMNGSVQLNWNANNVQSCLASGDWSGNRSTSGSEQINAIVSDSQFILTCTGPGGSIAESVNVTVASSGSGTALLSWTPPTTWTDGSALTNLDGYKIYYGTSPGNYSNTITLDNEGLSSYQIDNLVSATWYFTVTAFVASGEESAYSAEASKTIN